MSAQSDSPPPPKPPPHIFLNAAQGDLGRTVPTTSSPISPRPDASRPLVPQHIPAGLTAPKSPIPRDVYSNPSVPGSTELLLPPKLSKSRFRRFRDEETPPGSPLQSGMSTRRNSLDGDSEHNPFVTPFDESRGPSRAGSDDDNLNTQTVSEKFNITPSAGLLLYPEDVEKDDYLHNPDPNEKENRECDIFTRRGFVNVGGLILITLGVLLLFVGYPILTFVKKLVNPDLGPCSRLPNCIDTGPVPLMKNIRTSLIDPDTPSSAMTKKAADGTTLNLVFSDEFNKPGRTFYDGDDPYWEAVDLWYGVTQDLEWYDPDAAITRDGVLELRFDAYQNHGLNYRSGMIQSWNKLCYKGGHLEASISLPGTGGTVGFWPGFWAMGNLGRPGYASTTDGMWPYSYDDQCDAGITPNQSQTDGISYLPGMKLPACTCDGEDHPTPGKSRSSPEIDALEATAGYLGPGSSRPVGTVSQSFQLAPFDIWYRPNSDFLELYDPTITQMNAYQGGPFQQAVSGISTLNNDWYDGKRYQTYAFEYTTGSASGNIVWYIGDRQTWKVDHRAIGPNGNIGQRVIPREPMSLIMNFGMSTGFSPLDLPALSKLMPAIMRFDYVRIYQDPNNDDMVMSCDPPGYETTEYIAKHKDAFTNPNKTHWEDTKHSWPKNSVVHGC
ncbi:MAG: hypothetical protein M1825_001157 [Sarcosagium campestre]|nr:MAG: hypothetical protein M1825_001157 [Sarcosagium campestre]